MVLLKYYKGKSRVLGYRKPKNSLNSIKNALFAVPDF